MWGARVFAEAKSPKEIEFLKGMTTPIERIIDTSSEDLVATILSETTGLGVDVIFDNGASTNATSRKIIIDCLASHGRWITTNSQLQVSC